jgi:hypothetical protein
MGRHQPVCKSIVRRQSRIVRLLSFATTFIAAGVGTAHSQCNGAEPLRLELRIFKYGGTDSSVAKDKFSVFYQILIEKLKHIQFAAISPSANTSYLENLTIVPAPKDFANIQPPPAELKQLKATWEAFNSLILLAGSVDQQAGVYMVTSSIYWGHLKPQGMSETVYATMPVTAEGQRNSSDTHSLVMLFALTMDAIQRRCHSSIVSHLLQLAREKAMDLERRNELDGDLVKVRAFIEEQGKIIVNN